MGSVDGDQKDVRDMKITAILPGKFNAAKFEQELLVELERYKPKLQTNYNSTVRTWGTKPEFRIASKVTKSQASLTVAVRGAGAKEIWNYLDQGTRPHIIHPRNAQFLRFRPGYAPGTKPRSLLTVRPRTSGDYVYAKEVHHPGTAAREWHKTIAKKHEKPFARAMQKAVDSFARKSGHRIG